ncbi:hypothetical protein EV181_001188 [Coemansia sp. RSA 532]|nr:hypothetical protein EV181_001188 [Coemansia sp. RSA 532]
MNRLTLKLAVRTLHTGTVGTKGPTGRDLFNRMNSCIRDNDPSGAWLNYQQLLHMRTTEQPHSLNRSLFAQTPRPRDLPLSARPYIHDAHSRILRVLHINSIHGYSRPHLDQLAQWAAQYVREAAADSHVLAASDVNTLLHVFAVQRNGTAADHVWQYATLTGVVADVTNYNAYINACLRAGNYGRAFEVVREMRERGVQPSTWTQAYLIRLYGETGDLESARREFARACRNSPWTGVAETSSIGTKYWQEKTDDHGVYGLGIGTFNEMLGVLGRNGLMSEMRDLFMRFTGLSVEATDGELQARAQHTGLRPNAHTFHELIHWHATYWDMDTAVNIVRLMSKCGVRPVPKTLKLIVTPQTAERDVETCAQIAILLREEYGVQVSQSVVRIIETAREKAEEMEEQIKSAESQNPTFLQTLSNLTGLSGSAAPPKDS